MEQWLGVMAILLQYSVSVGTLGGAGNQILRSHYVPSNQIHYVTMIHYVPIAT